ncbi:MAG: alpha/beta hydrolase [Bdellovibrionaceae bacterium]|nr:alpha/beta hydrolase [Pseudobdellovibrionaceae bacterium]
MLSPQKYKVEKNTIFKTVDQENLTVDIYSPIQKGLKPAVIVVHGGGWKTRSGDMSRICEDLAQAGFVAFNITYRLAPKHLFPKPMEDVKDSIAWAKLNAAKYQVDPSQISGWGYSAGAHLILMAGLNPELGLKAIVAGGTPADLTVWPDSDMVKGFLGVGFKDNPVLWKQASPVNFVQKKSPRVFLYHGSLDHLVEVDQMYKMESALKVQGIEVETLKINYLGHIAVYFLSQKSVDEGIHFLKRNK